MILQLLTLPEKPQIIDLSNLRPKRTSAPRDAEEAKRRIGPYKPGDNRAVLCTSRGGNPTPNLTWWIDHEPTLNQSRRESKEKVENLLKGE